MRRHHTRTYCRETAVVGERVASFDRTIPNVGSINIGIENRDPGATRFEELGALIEFASASWQTEIRWMWERRLIFTGGGKE
ncbi:MAG: hypothetical protein U1D55_00150 [Phycisphaerae bacterium]